jgi:hypothetical protein
MTEIDMRQRSLSDIAIVWSTASESQEIIAESRKLVRETERLILLHRIYRQSLGRDKSELKSTSKAGIDNHPTPIIIGELPSRLSSLACNPFALRFSRASSLLPCRRPSPASCRQKPRHACGRSSRRTPQRKLSNSDRQTFENLHSLKISGFLAS